MIDIPTMFTKSQKDVTFGFKQYKINPQYLDPKKAMIERQFISTRNHPLQRPKVNRKPCFMDDYLRHIKFVPGPGTYPVARSISAKSFSNILKPTINKSVKKFTYLQQIESSISLKKATPSVGKYNIIKTLEQERSDALSTSQKVIRLNEKRHAFDDFVTKSNEVPGAGQYNLTVPKKLKKQPKTQEEYKKLHTQLAKRQSAKTARPDFLTYEPIPMAFNTFTQFQHEKSRKKFTSRWEHGKIVKKPSKTGFLVSPGPATYSLINKWQPQDQKTLKKLKETNKYAKLLDRTSSARQPGIYH